MKYFFRPFCFLLISIIFLCNCTQKRTYAEYRLLNSTEYSIQIKSYLKSTSALLNTINVAKNGSWDSVEFETTRDIRSVREVLFYMGDSVVVVFDNKRIEIIEASLKKQLGGIWLDENYKIEDLDEVTQVLSYTFTSKDYNNAEEIVD